MNLKDFENDIKETENIIKYYKIRNIKIFFKLNLFQKKRGVLQIQFSKALKTPLLADMSKNIKG